MEAPFPCDFPSLSFQSSPPRNPALATPEVCSYTPDARGRNPGLVDGTRLSTLHASGPAEAKLMSWV